MTAVASIPDPQTRTELWTSFASLLRSYCAAHGLNSTHQAVVEVGSENIMIRVAEHWLSLKEQFGVIIAQREDRTTRAYHLNEDGTLTANGQTEEMDMAAERFAREMFTA